MTSTDTTAIRAQYSDGEYLDAYPGEACATIRALCDETDRLRAENERAERAIKALSDLDRWVNHAMASLHRDIDMDEKLERADDIACDWFGSGWGASIRDELRALKSKDTNGEHQ